MMFALRANVILPGNLKTDGCVCDRPFLFLSDDNGITWKKETPFYNLDTSFIRKILFDKNGRLYVFTDNKAAFSSNDGFSVVAPTNTTVPSST